MCGIAGVFEYGRRGGVSEAQLVQMRETLSHRGPDGSGTWISADQRTGLVHRRLSIVDLEHGAQPMVGPSGAVVTFNGEIYNYPRLRSSLQSEGVRFATHCDTEVILHLYERYGERCVEHLEGMFAFALWDQRTGQLFFARDPIGEKPLYWTDAGNRFIFGSEIKALLAHPAVTPEVNEAILAPYLANLVTSPPATMFAGVWKVPPGHCGTCDVSGVKLWPYGTPIRARTWERPSFDEARDRVRSLLRDSVQDRLMADVPVGLLLSGGVDSTAIAALVRENGRRLSTFSVGYSDAGGTDERMEARRAARDLGTDHHELGISAADAIGFLADLVHHQDEPLADPVCLPLHFVCRLASQNGVKVVMAGEGADELFWGYPSYARILSRFRMLKALAIQPRVSRLGIATLAHAGLSSIGLDVLDGFARGRPLPMHMPLGLGSRDRRALLRQDAGCLTAGWDSRDAPDESAFDRLAFDTQEYEFGLRLPELLLMRIDRFSMASSVEARVPFLSPALVSYAYHLHPSLKMTDSRGRVTERRGKTVLREGLRGIVPDWVLDRPKRGFGPPVQEWMGAQLGEVLRALLQGEGLQRYFRTDEIEHRLEHPNAVGQVSMSLWPILNFALWHRHWVEREPLDELLEPFVVSAKRTSLG